MRMKKKFLEDLFQETKKKNQASFDQILQIKIDQEKKYLKATIRGLHADFDHYRSQRENFLERYAQEELRNNFSKREIFFILRSYLFSSHYGIGYMMKKELFL